MGEQKVFLVLVKADGGGTATVACTELRPDPIFPDKVMLMNIIGVSWPYRNYWLKLENWSIEKSSVLNWMAGPLREEFQMGLDNLQGEPPKTPWAPGSLPNEVLVNHQEEVEALVNRPDQK